MNKISIPKEHGAYVVLLAAWLLGIVYSTCVDVIGFALALILPLSLFFLQEPIRRIFRPRSKGNAQFDLFSLFLVVVALSSAALILIRAPETVFIGIPVVMVAVLYFYFIRKRSTPIILSLIGFVGLSLITPLTIVAARCPIRIEFLVSIWLLAAFFFCGSVLCVNIRLSAGRGVRLASIYHVVALIVMILLVQYGYLPLSAIAVIGISFFRLLLISMNKKTYVRLPIKIIGIQESVVTALGVLISMFKF
ncbi:MAG: YwiC-like family protein [Bacteroidota bacterium]|nr:YwiC-like family protein [Bacteroidota bacterium]